MSTTETDKTSNETTPRNPANVQTIDASRHGKLKLKPDPGFGHAKTRHLVAVNVSELGSCISNFPVVLVPHPSDGRQTLMAMFGLRNGENMFHGDEFWDSTYVPLGVQRHPFIVGLDDRKEERQLTTCLEIDSACLNEQDGMALYNADGTETELLGSAHKMLATMFEYGKFTESFIQKLQELGLIVPFDLALQTQNGNVSRITGLHTIDETKLKALSAEQLKDLQQRDFLAPCYLLLVSLHQLNRLIRQRNRKGGEQILNFKIEFGGNQQVAANA